MKSIIQSKKKCFICSKQTGLHDHHIYFGVAKRPISEKHGFKVWLCYEHHEGTYGVHGSKGHELDIFLKQTCQKKYEETHSRNEFIALIGRNYIMEDKDEWQCNNNDNNMHYHYNYLLVR